MQLPWVPERRLADPSSGFLADHLRSWSGPGPFPDVDAIATYQRAIGLWPASHCALEYHRWLFRSRLRADGRRFGRLMRRPLSQPVLSVSGAEDPALPVDGVARSRTHVVGELTEQVLNMQPGDVISLQVANPLVAEVDDVPVMECKCGVFNGQYALKVERLLSASDH
jgi:hypothetical protein